MTTITIIILLIAYFALTLVADKKLKAKNKELYDMSDKFYIVIKELHYSENKVKEFQKIKTLSPNGLFIFYSLLIGKEYAKLTIPSNLEKVTDSDYNNFSFIRILIGAEDLAKAIEVAIDDLNYSFEHGDFS